MLACFSPVLFGILLLIPRLASPRFGLLDDGVTVHFARQICQHLGLAIRVNADTGRFLPFYWLYQTAVYSIGWGQPIVFFAGNLILLALTVSLIVYLVLLRGGSRFQAWAAGLFFVLFGSVIENFYTLSKAEPLQVFALLLDLVLLLHMVRTPVPARRVVSFAGMVVVFFLACSAKETAVVLLPVSLGWLVIGLLPIAGKDDAMDRTAREIFFLAGILGGGAVFHSAAAGRSRSVS